MIYPKVREDSGFTWKRFLILYGGLAGLFTVFITIAFVFCSPWSVLAHSTGEKIFFFLILLIAFLYLFVLYTFSFAKRHLWK